MAVCVTFRVSLTELRLTARCINSVAVQTFCSRFFILFTYLYPSARHSSLSRGAKQTTPHSTSLGAVDEGIPLGLHATTPPGMPLQNETFTCKLTSSYPAHTSRRYGFTTFSLRWRAHRSFKRNNAFENRTPRKLSNATCPNRPHRPRCLDQTPLTENTKARTTCNLCGHPCTLCVSSYSMRCM